MGGSVLGDIVAGAGAVFSAFGRVGSKQYLIVLGLCVALFAGGAWVGAVLSGGVSSLIGEAVGDACLPQWAPAWIATVAGAVSALLTWVAVMMVVSIVGGAVILVILSPLLSHVADKEWVRAGHPEPHDTAADVARSIARGALVAVKYGLLQLLSLLAVLLLSLVPFVGVAAPFVGLLVNSFFYGSSFADYALERSGRGAVASIKFAHSHRAAMIGLGLPFAVAMLTPVIGSYIALFVAPASAAAGVSVIDHASAAMTRKG